jgi:hypothetical protein
LKAEQYENEHKLVRLISFIKATANDVRSIGADDLHSMLTMIDSSNLPELDRIAKRTSERARRASIGANVEQNGRANCFTAAAAAVANSNELDVMDVIIIENNNDMSFSPVHSQNPNITSSTNTDDHSNSIGPNEVGEIIYCERAHWLSNHNGFWRDQQTENGR